MQTVLFEPKYRVSQNKVYKVNQVFLEIDSVDQLNVTICRFYTIRLKFEHLFVRIYQVLRDIALFEHKFQARNFGQL